VIDYFKFQYAGDAFTDDGTSISTTLTYVAHSTDNTDDYTAFYNAGPFRINALYKDPISGVVNPVMTCTRVAVSPEKKGERVRRVVYSFSSKSPPGGPKSQGSGLDPTLQLPKYVWRRDEKMRAIYRAKKKNGSPTPIVNSALQWYRNTVMKPKKIAVCTITRNELVYNVPLCVSYWDTVNQAAFWGQPKGCVLCAGILATKVWERFGKGTLGYWELSYELHFILPFNSADWYSDFGMAAGDGAPDDGVDGWVEVVPDRGTVCFQAGQSLSSPNSPLRVARDANGIPTTEEQPLDGAGHLLTPTDIQNGNFHYRFFWVYDYADFSVFNLPQPV
jgi:hypothetical protein